MSERELLEARDDYFRQKEKYIMSENEYKTILSELTEWAQQASMVWKSRAKMSARSFGMS